MVDEKRTNAQFLNRDLHTSRNNKTYMYTRENLSGTTKTTYYGFTTYDNKGLQRDALTTVFYYFITSNF